MQSLALSSQLRVRWRHSAYFWKQCKHPRMLHRSSSLRQSIFQDIQEQSRKGPLVFHSTTQDPYRNLALEHYLLTQSHPTSRLLIFYTNRPCVVIGRNQNPWSECHLSLLQQGLRGVPIDLVRRRSGGGTVFHDAGNLNFCMIVPNDKEFTRRKHAEVVVNAIKSTHFPVEGTRLFEDVWVNERHDIVMSRQGNVFKISGSAFKLTRGRALHHGTILHSSPNLKNISAFLRSPSVNYIQAKGVESVRSPVSNLYDVPDDQRTELRVALTRAIVEQFTRLYGNLSEHSMGDPDITVPSVQKGLDELLSTEWKFGQTPRFEFRSPSVGGQQIFMSVNHGVVEESSMTHIRGQNLVDIQDWTNTRVPVLADLLHQTFPPFSPMGPKQSGQHNSVIDEQQQQSITRRLDDSSVELEREQNTIENR